LSSTSLESSWSTTAALTGERAHHPSAAACMRTSDLTLGMPPSNNAVWRRDMPAKLLRRIRAFESMTGRRMRFRSFTLLRSPLTLAHSQCTYWHAASILPRQLYYQLSSEMLLFGDALKRLHLNRRHDDRNVCSAWGEHAKPGGIFLGLPFSNKSGAGTEQHVCSTQRWNTLCHDVMIAVLRRSVHARQRGQLPARLLQCAPTKTDANMNVINTASGPVSA
jgi:hypothetical protein